MYSKAIRVLAALVFVELVSISLANAQGEHDVAIFRGALEQTVRELDRCHLVAATRGSQRVILGDVSPELPVMLLDIWLSGDDAQFRVFNKFSSTTDWWKLANFGESSAPLRTSELKDSEGLKVCIRSSGKYKWADWRRMRASADVPFDSIYSRSKASQRAPAVYLPLIGQHREWVQPGSQFAIDRLLSTPIEDWTAIGAETVDGVAAMLVEIEIFSREVDLTKVDDKLSITHLLKAWFSTEPEHGYLPVRIEKAVRYGYKGRVYPGEMRSETATSDLVYSCGRISRFGDRLWYPRIGKEVTYAQAPAARKPFDPDRIAESLVAKGSFSAEYAVATQREWRVSAIEQLESDIDVWFDAPRNACVYDADTEERYIEGVSKAESKRLLGLGFAPEQQSGFVFPWRWVLLGANAIVVAMLVVYMLKQQAA